MNAQILTKTNQNHFTNHFGTLTSQMNRYRESILQAKPYIDPERAVLTTEAYQTHQQEQTDVLRANVLAHILERMTIYIEPDTFLVGNQAQSNRWAPIFPEYSMKWVIEELDTFEKRPGDVFYITEDTKKKLKEIAPFWHNNTLEDRGLAAFPPNSRIFYDLGIIGADGNITSGDGHIAVNYQDLLKHGLKWYEKRIRDKQRKLDLTDYSQQKQLYFYQASLIVIQAIKKFAKRYVVLAKEQAKNTNDAKRKKQLQQIARVMSHVPYEPARNFYEAVQSVWFIHDILQIESNGHSVSYGRMDQYLDPYYETDLSNGNIDVEQATELLTNLFLKTLTINKVRSWAHTEFSAGSPLYQNITIGGQTSDGKDATNPVSYLILRAIAQAHLPQPNLTVRYFHGLSNTFMRECIEVVKQGLGMPAFNNDEIIIPSFIKRGVKKADAYNYSAIGCVETAVPGKWGYRCTGMSFINCNEWWY